MVYHICTLKVFTGLGGDLGGQTQLLQSLPASFPATPLSSRFKKSPLLIEDPSYVTDTSPYRQEVTDSHCIHGVATLERESTGPAQVCSFFIHSFPFCQAGDSMEGGLLLPLQHLLGPALPPSWQERRRHRLLHLRVPLSACARRW